MEDWFELDTQTGNTCFTSSGTKAYEFFEDYSIAINAKQERSWSTIKSETKKETKKQKKEKFEFVLKHTASIVAILLSLSTLLSAIFAISDKRELHSLQQELKQLRAAQDTLIQKPGLLQKPACIPPVHNTPTE